MGTGDEHTSARRLRLLQREFTTPPRTGPGARGPAPVHPSAPLNLDVIDHIGASVAEMVQHTRADAPDAGPVPADVSRVYEWARASTPELEPERLAVREAMIYRQGLEHAIAMGIKSVVQPHTCPACGCYGLLWQYTQAAAVCANRRCTDKNGMAHTWSLTQLAHHYITAKKLLNASAT